MKEQDRSLMAVETINALLTEDVTRVADNVRTNNRLLTFEEVRSLKTASETLTAISDWTANRAKKGAEKATTEELLEKLRDHPTVMKLLGAK